jgi:hypothetical protein
MPRVDYARGLETFADRPYPAITTSDGARMRLSAATRQIWASPEFDAIRAELSRAARSTIAPGYARAAQSIRRSYQEVAYSSGFAEAARRVWGTA